MKRAKSGENPKTQNQESKAYSHDSPIAFIMHSGFIFCIEIYKSPTKSHTRV